MLSRTLASATLALGASRLAGERVYCPQCGQRIGDEQRTCPFCGTTVPDEASGTGTCPECGAPRAPEDTYCRRCGVVLPLDLAALGLDESLAGRETGSSALELPEWLQPADIGAGGSAFPSDLDLPDWLREPESTSVGSVESPVPSVEFAVPRVPAVWGRSAAQEAGAERLFEPLPLLLVPEVRPAQAMPTGAEANLQAGGHNLARVALILALAVLIGVTIYIVWLNR
ncbi:MAG: zinc ribbon domain-containing protein [Thermomicrobium sp.]|nr:zinc ribbon domain-containing protein [Thermomicrobium sp.]